MVQDFYATLFSFYFLLGYAINPMKYKTRVELVHGKWEKVQSKNLKHK